jgi:signal transduction histidine kinase
LNAWAVKRDRSQRPGVSCARRTNDGGSDRQPGAGSNSRASARTNEISHQLHSSKLKFFGLVAAAPTLCKENSAHHGVTVEFDHHDMPDAISSGIPINLFSAFPRADTSSRKAMNIRPVVRPWASDLLSGVPVPK